MKKTNWFAGLLVGVGVMLSCSRGGSDNPDPGPPDPPDPPVTNEVDFWLTTGSRSSLIQLQSTTLGFRTVANANPVIEVDSIQKYQSIDGFGYTLTGGSAELLKNLDAAVRTTTLQQLFGNTTNAIGVSYLRISIGASDLSSSVYTYDDMPAGQTDPTLAQFSLAPEQQAGTGLIPVLKEILAINPNIKILGTPWTPPVWMKDNENSIGGSLKPEHYAVYAQYFVKYIQAMKAEGITIDAITIQNEPEHPANNPSMAMTATQQRDFIKNNLGPAFQAANITTKIILFDHNCDNPQYPISILNDPAAKAFVDGSAFHLYGGLPEAMGQVHAAHPDKNIYFTEQYTGAGGDFGGDLLWHYRNVIIGSMRNWSRTALEWNLANDPTYGPRTPGGCSDCKGALTISGSSSVAKNVSYYIIGQISKFVPPGSVRIASNNSGSLLSVAFERPDKKKVLVVLNESNNPASFNIKFKNKWVTPTLPAASVGTFVW